MALQMGMPRLDFHLNTSTGVLASTSVLDREQIGQYHLRIIAFDAGKFPRTSTSTLTVKGESMWTWKLDLISLCPLKPHWILVFNVQRVNYWLLRAVLWRMLPPAGETWRKSNGNEKRNIVLGQNAVSLNFAGKPEPSVEQHTRPRTSILMSLCLCVLCVRVSSGCKWWDAHLRPSRVQCFPEGECP